MALERGAIDRVRRDMVLCEIEMLDTGGGNEERKTDERAVLNEWMVVNVNGEPLPRTGAPEGVVVEELSHGSTGTNHVIHF